MSTARFNTLKDAAGNNPMAVADINQGRAKAWYNINGTGTIATRDSFNVSSFVDNGTGDYSANFSVPLANPDYALTYLGISSGNTFLMSGNFTSFLAGSARPGVILTWNATAGSNANAGDFSIVSGAIHGDAA